MRKSRSPIVIGALVSAVVLVFLAASPWYAGLRERTFDELTQALSDIPGEVRPVVVDIDRASLEHAGLRALDRGFLANLISAIAAAKPRVIALDILLEGGDSRSTAYHARRLAEATRDPHVETLARSFEDDDARLSKAMAAAPIVLGLALSPQSGGGLPQTVPVLVRGSVDARLWWHAAGLAAPLPLLTQAAAGQGVISLEGDVDGTIRRVPLLAAAGQQAVPGLAVEAVRVEQGAGTLILTGQPPAVNVGAFSFSLAPDAMLRLAGGGGDNSGPRTTLSAASVLAAGAANSALQGRVVLIGSSVPELGGLRLASGGRLVPSVSLQADAYAQLQAGIFPWRSSVLVALELLALVTVAALSVAAALWLSTLAGVGVTVLAGLVWIAGSLAAYAGTHALVDPMAGPLMAIAAFGSASLAAVAETRRRASLIQRRFERHLAPAVVQRLLDSPDLLRLAGERRPVSCIFTDIEGFTAMTERSEPEALVALLDRYFDGLGRIVIAHGGMIDKFVGDAVHAIFNAPLDLEDHPRKALACAQEILKFTEEFRDDPQSRRLGLGRTRIGLESGVAIVGDVGGGGKLDYTAHGNVINAAARLESANKELGSSICIGPGAAEAIGPAGLMPLGTLVLRGQSSAQSVYTVWPEGALEQDKALFLEAQECRQSDPAAAAIALDRIAGSLGSSSVLKRLREDCDARARLISQAT